MTALNRAMHLLEVIRPAPYMWNYFLLRDIRSGQLSEEITGRAQSAACGFCRRVVCQWPKVANPNSKRRHGGRVSNPLVDVLLAKTTSTHVEKCASEWLLATLCRWSTGTASQDVHNAVVAWRAEYMMPDREADKKYGIWAHGYSIPWELRGIFERLPRPVSDDFVAHLEAVLSSLSRVIALGLDVLKDRERAVATAGSARELCL